MTRDYCYKKSLEYFGGNELAADVFLKKYALKDGSEYIESTPEDMHVRLATEFARMLEKRGDKLFPGASTKTFKQVLHLFKDFRYIIPQGSIMAMLGNPYKVGSLSNCFVIGQPEDSYGGILHKDQELVQLMKRRGGVGLDISTLRPKDTRVNNAALTSTGAVSFCERYSNSTREVAQGGRRGALMLTIDIRHPDVLDFAVQKQDLSKVTGANISIMLRDDFLKAVEAKTEYVLRYPCDLKVIPEDINDLPLNHTRIDEESGSIFKRVDAVKLWESIIKCARETAEPGLIFLDRQWDYSPDGVYQEYRGVTTNPCSEIFMQMYDACRLICLNLFSFVNDPFTRKAKIDFDKLYLYSYAQQVLADCLVDLEVEHINRILEKIGRDPEDDDIKRAEFDLWLKISRVCQAGRRTGCGFTGLGDALAALNLKYDSPKALAMVERMMKIKMKGELNASIDLARKHGTFEGCETGNRDTHEYKKVGSRKHQRFEPQNPFYAMLLEEFPEEVKRMRKYGRRNVSWSTVAPTGSVSLLTQTTSGLEPLFLPFYMRRKKVNPGDDAVRVDFVDKTGDAWQEYPVLHSKFESWYNSTKGLVGEKQRDANLCESLKENEQDLKIMSGEELDCVFKMSPWHDSTANDIDWVRRVEMQSVIQKYTSHSISSTINLPNDVSLESVEQIYFEAWKKGLKGITVYRDGSRTGVLVSNTPSEIPEFVHTHAPKRDKKLECDVYHTTAKGVRWTVVVGLLLEKPYEVFAIPGEVGMAKEKGTLEKVKKGVYKLEQEKGGTMNDLTAHMSEEEEALTRMISTALRHGAEINFVVEQLNKTRGGLTSFAKGISRVLKIYIPDGTKSTATCSECGSENVIFEEGCQRCLDCGSSKCG